MQGSCEQRVSWPRPLVCSNLAASLSARAWVLEEGLIGDKGSPSEDDLQKKGCAQVRGPNGVLGSGQMCSLSWQMLFFKNF